jgi:flagellar protein FliJ
MRKFDFRLQKVLEYRLSQEQEAKNAYLRAQAERVKAEQELGRIFDWRSKLLEESYCSIHDRISLELLLQTVEDKEHHQRTVIEVLEVDEQTAMEAWQEAKKELETLEKMREKAYEQWRHESERLEQAELDEWAVLRRKS